MDFFLYLCSPIMNTRALHLILISLLIVSCHPLQRRQQGAAVALDGRYIYHSQIDSITRGLSPEDSASTADAYIRRWAENILLYADAKSTINPQIEEMVESYRRSLYVYESEKRYIDRHMPGNVDDSLIVSFFDSHADQLILPQTIVRGLMLILPKGAPNRRDLDTWLEHPDEHIEDIERYAYANASGYELFVDRWMTVSQILMRMPLSDREIQNRLHTNTTIETTDSLSTYVLRVTDCAMAGKTMPLSYARPEIERIILSQRRVQYLQRQRDELYRDAVRFNKIKFYDE